MNKRSSPEPDWALLTHGAPSWLKAMQDFIAGGWHTTTAHHTQAGAGNGAVLVSVDGGCQGVKDTAAGIITATSQQYPLKMASLPSCMALMTSAH
jgi:ABC-type sugar transport system substrate-binding protein